MYDFAIIGSGAAGGRLAYDLTAGGADCVLIEAGRAFDAATFPGHELDYTAQMFWAGGLELGVNGRLGFLRAKCLGGGPVINQALMDRFDEVAFDDWRLKSGISFFNTTDMAPHYEAAEEGMVLQEIPERHYRQNSRIFIRAFDALGYGWKPLRRAESDCAHDHGSDCIVCLGGCPRDSKQSPVVTTIRWATEKGLTIESEFEVNTVLDLRDKVMIFGAQRGQKAEITAARAVLAAGSVGTTSILLRSASLKKTPALGLNFCCHPQFMTYALFDEPVDAHKGAFQAVKSDDARFRRAGYKFENVFAPPGATALLLPGFGRPHMEVMRKYRFLACMEVCVRDEPGGRLRVDRRGRTLIDKPLTDSDRKKIEEGLDRIDEMFHAAGAGRVIRGEQGFGLHLMGGCVMGTDPESSVVSPDFQIHDHPNLFVADSSLFPSAPGINPSLTVMALSHRAGRVMLSR